MAAKDMTKEQAIENIKANLAHLDIYAFTEIVRRGNAEYLKKETGVFISNDKGEVPDANIHIDLAVADREALLKTFKEKLVEKFGSIENAVDFAEAKSVFKWYYLRRREGGNFTFSAEYGKPSLFHLLRYLVTGEWDDDLRESNGIIDKYRDDLVTCKKVTIEELNGLTIKFYRNGRLDIKGLTEEQDATITRLDNLTHFRK